LDHPVYLPVYTDVCNSWLLCRCTSRFNDHCCVGNFSMSSDDVTDRWTALVLQPDKDGDVPMQLLRTSAAVVIFCYYTWSVYYRSWCELLLNGIHCKRFSEWINCNRYKTTLSRPIAAQKKAHECPYYVEMFYAQKFKWENVTLTCIKTTFIRFMLTTTHNTTKQTGAGRSGLYAP